MKILKILKTVPLGAALALSALYAVIAIALIGEPSFAAIPQRMIVMPMMSLLSLAAAYSIGDMIYRIWRPLP